MLTEHEIGKVLLDATVADEMKYSLSEKERGFLAFLADNGTVYSGRSSMVDDNAWEEWRRRFSGSEMLLDGEPLNAMVQIARNDISRYRVLFQQPETSGTVFLVMCRPDSSNYIGRRRLRKSGGIDALDMALCLTGVDWIKLNLLREDYKQAVLIYARTFAKSGAIPIAVVEQLSTVSPQEAHHMSIYELVLKSAYGDQERASAYQAFSQTYQKFEGSLDVKARKLELTKIY